MLDGRFMRLHGGAGTRPGARPDGRLGSGHRALNKVLGAQFLTDVQAFVAALDTIFGGFRQRAEATYRCCRRTERRSSWSPHQSRTRCARRRTSPNGSPASGCPSPASSSTDCTSTALEHHRGGRRVAGQRARRRVTPSEQATSELLRRARRTGAAFEARGTGGPAVHRGAPAGADGGGAGASRRRPRPRRAARDRRPAGQALSARRRTEGSCARSSRSDDGGATHGARAQSCRPRRPTRCGCRALRPGIRPARSIDAQICLARFCSAPLTKSASELP